MDGIRITGVREVVALLEQELTGPKLRQKTRKAKNKEARIVVKAIKASVPARYKSVRATVGYSTKTDKGDKSITTKIGLGVGKRRTRKKQPKRSSEGGVGISSQNVHWGALGTDARLKSDGTPTGAMPKTWGGLILPAMQSTRAEREKAVVQSLREDLEKLRAAK